MKITVARVHGGFIMDRDDGARQVCQDPSTALGVVAGALRCRDDLAVHLVARHARFALDTFGPGPRLEGTLAHIREELAEIEAAPDDLEEWVDVILLAINGAARQGYSSHDIADAIAAKIAKNEARTWPDWRDLPEGEPIEHDRSRDA